MYFIALVYQYQKGYFLCEYFVLENTPNGSNTFTTNYYVYCILHVYIFKKYSTYVM